MSALHACHAVLHDQHAEVEDPQSSTIPNQQSDKSVHSSDLRVRAETSHPIGYDMRLLLLVYEVIISI